MRRCAISLYSAAKLHRICHSCSEKPATVGGNEDASFMGCSQLFELIDITPGSIQGQPRGVTRAQRVHLASFACANQGLAEVLPGGAGESSCTVKSTLKLLHRTRRTSFFKDGLCPQEDRSDDA